MFTRANGVVVILKSTDISWVDPSSFGRGTVVFALID